MCDEILDKLDDEKTNDMAKGVMIQKIIETCQMQKVCVGDCIIQNQC